MGRLLDKARTIKPVHSPKRRYDAEQLELAVEYTLGKLTHGQVRAAMSYRSKNMLGWAMSIIRAAAVSGKIDIIIK